MLRINKITTHDYRRRFVKPVTICGVQETSSHFRIVDTTMAGVSEVECSILEPRLQSVEVRQRLRLYLNNKHTCIIPKTLGVPGTETLQWQVSETEVSFLNWYFPYFGFQTYIHLQSSVYIRVYLGKHSTHIVKVLRALGILSMMINQSSSINT